MHQLAYLGSALSETAEHGIVRYNFEVKILTSRVKICGVPDGGLRTHSMPLQACPVRALFESHGQVSEIDASK